jgi:restriction endonuclease S subunit
MKLKLKEIVEIKSGFLFKNAVSAFKKGDTVVVQLKDVSARGELALSGLEKVNLSLNDSIVQIRIGDVLFKAKTNHPVAVVIREDLGVAVATAHYFVLRIVDQRVSPGYLAWFLNQKPAQAYFDKHGAGTRIMVVNKQVLGELEINLPPLAVQETIVKLHDLQVREDALLDQLKEKKRALMERQLRRAVEESLKETTHG